MSHESHRAFSTPSWANPMFLQVTPNAAIYFYQFSTPALPTNLTWTTRFTIAAADGSTTDPANSTQPDGSAIPWGVGELVDESTAVAAPSYLSSSSSSSDTTAAAADTTAAATTAAAGTAAAGTTSASMTKVASTAPAAPTSASASTASNSTTATDGADSGALAARGADGLVLRAGAALAAAALAFSVVF